jgi:ADP-heptose:LPS heptosyltransferase
MNLRSQIYTAQFNARRWLSGRYYRWRNVFEPPAELTAPRRVLMVVAGLLGDSVMSIPTIMAARQIWRDAEIVVLGKKHNFELLAACPFISDFYVYQPDPFSLKHKSETATLQKWLNEANFDAAFILLGDQFAHLLAKARIPLRVGVKGDLQEPCLTHTYEIGSPRTWGANERLNSLRALGCAVDNIAPQLWVQEAARQSAKQKLIECGLETAAEYAVVHPFGSTRRQWWSLDKTVELAHHLRSDYNLKTVLIGGRETIEAVTETVKENLVDTTGKLSLPELLAVIEGAKFVVTTDSGPFHIAGALQKPIIGLFRSRRPEHAAAYETAKTVFGKDETCQSACRWDFCRAKPCRQLEEISTDGVLKTVVQQRATSEV